MSACLRCGKRNGTHHLAVTGVRSTELQDGPPCHYCYECGRAVLLARPWQCVDVQPTLDEALRA